MRPFPGRVYTTPRHAVPASPSHAMETALQRRPDTRRFGRQNQSFPTGSTVIVSQHHWSGRKVARSKSGHGWITFQARSLDGARPKRERRQATTTYYVGHGVSGAWGGATRTAPRPNETLCGGMHSFLPSHAHHQSRCRCCRHCRNHLFINNSILSVDNVRSR